MRTTHTYATLEISQSAYDEIAAKLREAKYDHAFIDQGGNPTVIDMHGIGLIADPARSAEVVDNARTRLLREFHKTRLQSDVTVNCNDLGALLYPETGGGEAALAIGEHAFRAGFKAGTKYQPGEAGLEEEQSEWNEYEPSEEIKALS